MNILALDLSLTASGWALSGGPSGIYSPPKAFRAHCERAFATYRELLAAGWPRELARAVLPVSTYSHMFATVSLLNLFRFLTLRCDIHAQLEIQLYANALLHLANNVAPVSCAAWRESRA